MTAPKMRRDPRFYCQNASRRDAHSICIFIVKNGHRESYDKIRASELPPAMAIFIVKKRGVLSFFRTLRSTRASADAPLSCFLASSWKVSAPKV